MSDYAVVLVTTPDVSEAESIATLLLERRLIACANLLPGVTSLFWWEGKIERSQEVLLVMKTRFELLTEVTEAVTKAHSYEVCEVVALPITGGSHAYLRWISQSVQ